jgi:hypothetical protein
MEKQQKTKEIKEKKLENAHFLLKFPIGVLFFAILEYLFLMFLLEVKSIDEK